MTKQTFYKKYGKEEIEKAMLLLCEFEEILPERNKEEHSESVIKTIDLLSDFILHIKKLYRC